MDPSSSAPAKPPPPGRKGAKMFYPSDDAVLRGQVEVPEKVIRARRAVEESRPDILGLQGPKWNMSVSLPSSKYVQEVADTRLSNTLSPAHINASDFRKLKGSTFQGEHIHNNTFDRGEFTGGWDHTQTLNRKAALDATKKLDQAAATARSRWNQKIEGKYKPLEKQYEEQLQTIRNMKLSNSWDPKVGLSKQPEGEQPVKRRHRPGRATKDDVAAVSELDGFEQMLSTLELQKQSQSEQQDEQ